MDRPASALSMLPDPFSSAYEHAAPPSPPPASAPRARPFAPKGRSMTVKVKPQLVRVPPPLPPPPDPEPEPIPEPEPPAPVLLRPVGWVPLLPMITASSFAHEDPPAPSAEPPLEERPVVEDKRTHRMRGVDVDSGENVFWNAPVLDVAGDHYDGTVVDVVVEKTFKKK